MSAEVLEITSKPLDRHNFGVLDCDTLICILTLMVFVESVRHAIISPFTIFPFLECERDTIVCQFPTRSTWKSDRLELVLFFDFRSATYFLEKTVIRLINTPQLLLDPLTRQSFPMRVRGSLQFSEVSGHRIIVRIRQSIFIPLTLPFVEVVMHLPHVVKHVAKTNRVRLMPKLIFVGFHDFHSLTVLTAVQVGRQTHYQVVTLELSATVML